MARKLLLLLLVCTSFLVHDVTGKRRKDKDREKQSLSENTENVCEIPDPNRSIDCFCDKAGYQNASDATCWLFYELQPDSVVWGYFTSQTNIEKLKINIRPDGILKYVPTWVLSQLRNLKVFDVLYGDIAEISPYAFANLSSLQEISMTRNKIIELKPYSFAKLPKLTQVTLDDNRITEIRREVFIGLPVLKSLYIDRNNLRLIYDRAFLHLYRLEELELNGNQLSVITRDTFMGLQSLKVLSLQDNRIKMLGEYTFNETPFLAELSMDRNGLQYINENAFHGLSQLHRLSLSENQLKSLPNNVFNDTPNIRFLDLRDNSLSMLSSETVRPIMESLKDVSTYFFVEGNNLVCNCQLSWVYPLRNETASDQIRNSLDELTCKPQVDAKKKLLDDIEEKLLEDIEGKLPDDPKKNLQSDIRRLTQDITDSLLGSTMKPLRIVDDDDVFIEQGYDSYGRPVQPNFVTTESNSVKHLFDIPMQDLPCPENVHRDHETSVTPDLKSKSGQGRNKNACIYHYIVSAMFVLILTVM